MTYNNLLFRRQFLITPRLCKSFNDWHHKSFGFFQIYAHPDVELSVLEAGNSTSRMALIGYMLDPDHPERSNIEILHDMSNSLDSIDRISTYLRSIGGRFVLIVSTPKDTFLFHDPCGLRTVYYTRFEGNISIASQPLLFEQVMPLNANDSFFTYHHSEYKKTHIEHWIPSGCSLYKNIHHLIPNHYLQFSTFEQIRYWPKGELKARRLDEAVHEASGLLQRLMQSANTRFKLALPLTAGWDSRMLLSACRNIANDIFFYTLQYRDLQLQSPDIRIPGELLKSLGYDHHLIDCRRTPNKDFDDIYEKSSSMSHKEDWGRIAYGMAETYPPDRVCVKGTCSEICRCFYYNSGRHPLISSADEIITLTEGWNSLSFVVDQLSDWYSKVKVLATDSGVDILDLFYWEHRMGSWQAQSQLEWDIVQEAYTPFNHRGLLEIMLGVSPELRCEPDCLLYKKMYEVLWPEVMNQPINPPETASTELKEVSSRQCVFEGIEQGLLLIEKMHRKLDELQGELQEKKGLADAQARDLEHLRSMLSQRNTELRKAVKNYQNSLSWRITKPLRMVHEKLFSLVRRDGDGDRRVLQEQEQRKMPEVAKAPAPAEVQAVDNAGVLPASPGDVFAQPWHRLLRRQLLLEKLNARSRRPLTIEMAITEDSEVTPAGDSYTAKGLGKELARLGYNLAYLPRAPEERWYDMPEDTDMLIVLVEDYDLRKVMNRRQMLKVAWVRNCVELWTGHEWFREYDLVLVSSEEAGRVIREKTGKESRLLMIGADTDIFHPMPPQERYACDIVFSGNYWGVPREIIESLHIRPGWNCSFYGINWDRVESCKGYWKGFARYSELPAIYNSAKIVLDDHHLYVTKALGAINSRVFEAMACGCCVVTNAVRGIDKVFPEGAVAVYHDREELTGILSALLSDDNRRKEMGRIAREEILSHHTYRKRAAQFKKILLEAAENELFR